MENVTPCILRAGLEPALGHGKPADAAPGTAAPAADGPGGRGPLLPTAQSFTPRSAHRSKHLVSMLLDPEQKLSASPNRQFAGKDILCEIT